MATAEHLARNLGVEPNDLRHVEVRFHNGRQWTVECHWEYRVDGQWKEVPWTSTID